MKRFCSALLAWSLLATPALAATEINYWFWDALQKPAYQACATAFEAKHPDIKIKITQNGWNDYWTGLTTGFVSGTAPDVFTDHLSRYPEFAANGMIVDVAPLIARDGVRTDLYAAGLLSVWQREGKTYGLPKDWDTIALVYNADMLKAAGVTPAQLDGATWNPKDGGTFEKLLAKLTVDEAGKRASEAGFDRAKVKQYGLLIDGSAIDGYGQATWSAFAASNGFKFNDGVWSSRYYYDDPKLAEAIQWLVDVSLKRGLSAPTVDTSKLGASAVFAAGKGAVIVDGSWKIGWYLSQSPFKVGFAMLPVGPAGRKSMFNGLADSIWTGSKHQKEAWEWVKFLGSPACQDIVAGHGVVFTAVAKANAKTREVYAKKGADVSAFIDEAKPETTFAYPITDHASEISSIVKSAFDNVFLGKVDVRSELARANKDVNALFK
jgi:multiple sugar transport system substrate-binding protein